MLVVDESDAHSAEGISEEEIIDESESGSENSSGNGEEESSLSEVEVFAKNLTMRANRGTKIEKLLRK